MISIHNLQLTSLWLNLPEIQFSFMDYNELSDTVIEQIKWYMHNGLEIIVLQNIFEYVLKDFLVAENKVINKTDVDGDCFL